MDIVAIIIDGKTFQDDEMILVLGVLRQGKKVVLGFIQSGTENATVCKAFLNDLLERGLKVVAARFLRGFTGYVQTDGYAGYDFLDSHPDFIYVGCWAHARRKFVDVIKAAPKPKNGDSAPGSADVALDYIRKLYAIESQAQEGGLPPEDLLRQRQESAKPILAEFKGWLDVKSSQTPPKSLLGKAVSYALKQWPRLIRYIEDPCLRPDNNQAENTIRPFVVGRKNWLFSGHPMGAKASAALYSLIETAKANGLEPYSYLRFLFEKLPVADSTPDFKALLPQYVDRNRLLR